MEKKRLKELVRNEASVQHLLEQSNLLEPLKKEVRKQLPSLQPNELDKLCRDIIGQGAAEVAREAGEARAHELAEQIRDRTLELLNEIAQDKDQLSKLAKEGEVSEDFFRSAIRQAFGVEGNGEE